MVFWVSVVAALVLIVIVAAVIWGQREPSPHARSKNSASERSDTVCASAPAPWSENRVNQLQSAGLKFKPPWRSDSGCGPSLFHEGVIGSNKAGPALSKLGWPAGASQLSRSSILSKPLAITMGAGGVLMFHRVIVIPAYQYNGTGRLPADLFY